MKIFAPHATDFYKPGHANMFPSGMTRIYGNFTPRSDRLAKVLPDFDHKYVWFGAQGVLQYLLIEQWNETFFNVDKVKAIAKLRRRMDSSLGVGVINMQRWEDLHDLGYLPVEIKTLPEGARVNMRVSPFTITGTDDKFAWVSQFLETQLSAELWPQLTSATTAHEYRRLLDKYANISGADPNFVNFQGHDFSARGMMGVAAGAISGAGHLLSFMGTDTVAAIDYMEDYYPDKQNPGNGPFIAGSIPATEHAVSSANIILIAQQLKEKGEWNGWKFSELNPTQLADNEVDIMLVAETAFMRHCLVNLFPTGPFSYVADTYDFWSVVSVIAPFLKQYIMAREPDALGRPGCIVFRPDSGDPIKIILGDKQAAVGSPEYRGAVQLNWDNFGGTINDRTFKTVDSHVGLIYGDSITLERAQVIIPGMVELGFVSTSCVLGIGSYTYQYVTRDSFGTAMKGTQDTVDNVDYELYKDPKTDSGIKKSAVGLLRAELENGEYVQYDRQTREQEAQGELTTAFKNSKMTKMYSYTEVRERLLKS